MSFEIKDKEIKNVYVLRSDLPSNSIENIDCICYDYYVFFAYNEEINIFNKEELREIRDETITTSEETFKDYYCKIWNEEGYNIIIIDYNTY